MRIVLALLLLAGMGGCATRGGSYDAANRSTITLQEIDAADQLNAYELIRSLRPHWLRARPNSILGRNPLAVYVDGSRFGAGPDALMSISRVNIDSIRYYSASAAQARFGLDNTNGAVEIRSRNR